MSFLAQHWPSIGSMWLICVLVGLELIDHAVDLD